MKAVLILISVLVAVTICAVPVWSQGQAGGPPPPPHRAIQPPPPADKIDKLTEKLTLTADQATEFKTLLTTIDTTIQPLFEAAETANKALHQAFAAADFESASNLITAASDAELALTKASLAAWGQIQTSGILTADQFTLLLAGPGKVTEPPADSQTGNGSSSSGKGRGTNGHKK